MMWLLKKLLSAVWAVVVTLVTVCITIPFILVCGVGVIVSIPLGILLLPFIFFGSWLVNKIK